MNHIIFEFLNFSACPQGIFLKLQKTEWHKKQFDSEYVRDIRSFFLFLSGIRP